MQLAQDAGPDLELSNRIGFSEHAADAEVGRTRYEVGQAADESGLGSEVEVYGGEGNTGRGGHRLHGCCAVASLPEYLFRGLEDRKLSPVATFPALG